MYILVLINRYPTGVDTYIFVHNFLFGIGGGRGGGSVIWTDDDEIGK